MSSAEQAPFNTMDATVRVLDPKQTPRENEGVFLPNFDTRVERLVHLETETPDSQGNHLNRYSARLSDGSQIGVNICEPHTRRTDIAVLETPAWFTNLHGFNEYTQRELGALGIPSVLVGHVGQDRKSAAREIGSALIQPWKTVREIRNISLARQAHNMLQVFEYIKESVQVDPLHVLLHGNSRGAMVQAPLIAMAEKNELHIPFAMKVAPCFAVGFNRAFAREFASVPSKEVLNAGRLAVRNLFDMAGSGLNTINLSPKAMAYELGHIKTLFNGDAGKYVSLIPSSQNMLLLAYEDDIAGQKEAWEELYTDHYNVVVRGVPGAHLSIADKRTRSLMARVFDTYANQLHDGQHPTKLDHTHIRRSVHSVS